MAYREKTPAEEFEKQVRGENYLPSQDTIQEFCEQEGEEIDRFLGRTTDDIFAGCDPRDQRVRDSERDARLRHRDYDDTIKPVESLIRRSPEVFTVLRDSIDAGEAAHTLGELIQNPALADHPKYKGFEEYMRYVAELKTGKFDNMSPADHERALNDYKEHANEGETIEEFFTRWR